MEYLEIKIEVLLNLKIKIESKNRTLWHHGNLAGYQEIKHGSIQIRFLGEQKLKASSGKLSYKQNRKKKSQNKIYHKIKAVFKSMLSLISEVLHLIHDSSKTRHIPNWAWPNIHEIM